MPPCLEFTSDRTPFVAATHPQTRPLVSVHIPPDTPDPGDQDGAARLDSLHPAAHVLGPVRSAGTMHPCQKVYYLKHKRNCAVNVKEATVGDKGCTVCSILWLILTPSTAKMLQVPGRFFPVA